MPLFNLDETHAVTVYQVQGHMLAEMLKTKLEAAGIPAALRYESLGRVFGLTVDGLGQVDILVPVEFAEQAIDLLSDEDALSPTTDSEESAAD